MVNFSPISYNQHYYPQAQPVSNPMLQNPTQAYYPNNNFANNYWQYQNVNGYNNIPNIHYANSLGNNFAIANTLLNGFNMEFPNLESYTMTDTLARKAQQTNPNSPQTIAIKEQSDFLFKKMINILNNRPKDQENMHFSEYINMVVQEFKTHHHGNCGERAYILCDKLNKMGIKNHATIQIEGKENYQSHVFNVIGLAPDADVTKPETWGPNAVVVDAWANRILQPQDAINFYRDFFDYDTNTKMNFEELGYKYFKSPN